MTPQEKLKLIGQDQFGIAASNDGRLQKSYYNTEWLIGRVLQIEGEIKRAMKETGTSTSTYHILKKALETMP